ncbi:MAG: hypothetical protein WC373_01815 [Smithella sp.]|jgi:hypothetical protein
MRCVPDLAAVEIDKLRKADIPISDDDIVWLSSLACRVENPDGQSAESAGIIDGIRLSNGEIMRPLTVCASKWLHKYGPVFGDNTDIFAVAFAMIYPERVTELRTAKDSILAVSDWTEKLNVSVNEIAHAVERMLSNDDPHDPDAKKIDTETIISMLVTVTGQPFEYWKKQSWVNVNNAYTGAIKWAGMLSEQMENPDAKGSREALKDLCLAINEIRNRNKKDDGEERNIMDSAG